MSFVKCTECGKEVHESANNCPICYASLPPKQCKTCSNLAVHGGWYCAECHLLESKVAEYNRDAKMKALVDEMSKRPGFVPSKNKNTKTAKVMGFVGLAAGAPLAAIVAILLVAFVIGLLIAFANWDGQIVIPVREVP